MSRYDYPEGRSPGDSAAVFLIYLPIICAACGILVPRPGIEPVPSALEVQSLNRWTAREVPLTLIITAGVEVFSWGWGRRERG